jgi:hypothetical protein
MAKERVYACGDPTWVDGDSTAKFPPNQVSVRPGVEVQFFRDGDAIGVATGHLTDETFDEANSEHDRVTWPYFVWLDRKEVNKLIRDLRRARNVTFGGDE